MAQSMTGLGSRRTYFVSVLILRSYANHTMIRTTVQSVRMQVHRSFYTLDNHDEELFSAAPRTCEVRMDDDFPKQVMLDDLV
jgi:hypothetical protein